MKLLYSRLLLITSFIFLTSVSFGSHGGDLSLPDTVTYVSPLREENERCFKCHGQQQYEYTNESLDRQVKVLMCTERIVDKKEFYDSNHRSFGCTDCHSVQYVDFPHQGDLRMELKYNCLDCHGGDETYSSFNFEEIDTEYQQSTHFKLEEDGFTCWKCHDPHSYKINIRDSKNLKETILYDNTICLNCHSNFSHFQLLTERDEINILKKHEWLPNQASHFSSVRCIECHTKVNDSILVSHLILPQEEAVRLCNECHSKNSLLMASLYKFQSREQRSDGFLNGIILNESYVIGANRNTYLNKTSIILFAVIIIIISVHSVFRIIRR